MDTEIQEWYCDACREKYPLKEKDEHIQSDYHESNARFMEYASDYKDYRLCIEKGLIENTIVLTFEEFLERRREAERQYQFSKEGFEFIKNMNSDNVCEFINM